MGRDTPYLPDEIIQEILKRLPVRSLIRLQCVCKYWKNLIKSPSPSFIDENLRHQNPSLLLWQRDIFGPLRSQFRRSGPLLLRSIDSEMHIGKVQSPPLLSPWWNVCIVGSCNGLVCVGINESNMSAFLVWNPATGDARRIPRTKSYELDVWDCSGFGFSTIANDYKIVQVYDEDAKARISSIEVYSLNTGSWKEIELGPIKDAIPYGESITFNGCIFWEGIKVEEEEEGDDDYLIVSFDIAKEVFTFIPGLREVGNIQLTVYNDKLAILSMTLQNYLHINLWVFEEGLGSSTGRWIPMKKYIGFPHLDTFRIPITIWRNNEIVCTTLQADESRIRFFTKEGETFTIPGYYVNVFNHVESLVPVGISHC
ncbi:hypothetical protein QN277_005757 [Acacia crassicarpa]|uniref:F-box domain-containing protein n=1 Tax=Acacia crassicarpa TaxID=499986 RepID=A0AAE1J0C0_9FABA|nr:hypothetical protein QN277_005757 [Acacia crassicarpa]